MALRLIDTSPAGAAAVTASDAEIVSRARAALAARDLDAYQACAAETADIADANRRYVARRTLVEAGLQADHGAGAAAAAALLATARVALEVLAPAPAEPVLLNLAGVAQYELGALRGAEALFRAAHRLDPHLDHVERNLRQLKKARKRGRQVALPPAVSRALPELEARAKQLAAAARPGDVERISLCMIVRDEEEVLGRCLRSAVDAVDEVIVVDTGSADRTVEIAREHGATVLEHAWDDDFAAARNVGLEAATGEWILFLDADEVLAADDAPRLRELTRRTWREGFMLTLANRVGRDDDNAISFNDALRLFRNKPEYRFVGRVHEDVLQRLPGDAPERVESGGVRIDHDGYLLRTRQAKDKTRRNVELLERQLAEEGSSHYVHFNLGTEYAAAGHAAGALEHLGRAWELLLADPSPAVQPFGPALASRYAGALRAAGRLDEALRVTERGLGLYEGFTDLVFEQALVARARGDAAKAEGLLRRCLELGDAPSRYARRLGAGSHLAAAELAELLVARGEAEEAEPLLRAALDADPANDAARLALADALLQQGRHAEAGATAAAVADDSPFAPVAAVSQALAAIAGGDRAATAAALDRAERTGTPAHERELLARWAAVADGAPAPDAPLERAALPLLLTVLETLLRTQDVDAFAAVLPLADRIDGLTARERREALARLYLRRGFLDSAADEWAAACEEDGPDAAALTGLAQVAAARGVTDDARLFAEAAVELDPAAAGAARLLSALAA